MTDCRNRLGVGRAAGQAGVGFDAAFGAGRRGRNLSVTVVVRVRGRDYFGVSFAAGQAEIDDFAFCVTGRLCDADDVVAGMPVASGHCRVEGAAADFAGEGEPQYSGFASV